MANVNEIWLMAKDRLQEYLSFSDISMDLWFKNMSLGVLTEDTAYFQIENDFKQNIVKTRYIDEVGKALSEILGFEVEVVILSIEGNTFENQLAKYLSDKHEEEELERMAAMPKPSENFKRMDNSYLVREIKPTDEDEKSGQVLVSPSLPECLPEYTFDNFVVGSSNKLAYTTARTVAQAPAADRTINPLFLYGDPGLGKTHLLYAITREITKNYPGFNIIYVKGEDFTNELIEAIAMKAPVQFREKYRKADVLLVDDIQFIAGKVGVQEEFFHTFDALFEAGKQIIVSSDRPPKDMKTLEARLKSRFEMSPLIDIQAPDLELRVAILKRKAVALGMNVPNDVLMFLGESIKDNIRQIEGALKKMKALALIRGEDIGMSHAKTVVNDILTNQSTAITPEKILSYVAQKYNVPEEDIMSSKRTKNISVSRHVCCYLMRKLTDMSLNDIGKFFNRDHATIMASIQNVEKEIKKSPEFENSITEIKRDIKSGNSEQ